MPSIEIVEKIYHQIRHLMTRHIEDNLSDTSGSLSIEDQKAPDSWTNMRQNIRTYLKTDRKEMTHEQMVQTLEKDLRGKISVSFYEWLTIVQTNIEMQIYTEFLRNKAKEAESKMHAKLSKSNSSVQKAEKQMVQLNKIVREQKEQIEKLNVTLEE